MDSNDYIRYEITSYGYYCKKTNIFNYFKFPNCKTVPTLAHLTSGKQNSSLHRRQLSTKTTDFERYFSDKMLAKTSSIL